MLERAAELVRDREDELTIAIAAEAGKPLKTARVEAQRCAGTLDYSAVEARTLAGEAVPLEGSAAGAGKLGLIIRVPYGVVAAISPFNFPLNLVAHKLGPAIAAGNTVVLKPAGQTPISAIKLAEILVDAGLPDGWVNVVCGSGAKIGSALTEDERVGAISFTGSAAVGWDIRARAPRKKVNLELGSTAPLVVHEDGDWERAADGARLHAFSHAGQTASPCSGSRARGGDRPVPRPIGRERPGPCRRRPARSRHRRGAADLTRRPRPREGVDRRGRRERRRDHRRRGPHRRGPLPGADRDPGAGPRGARVVRRDLRAGRDPARVLSFDDAIELANDARFGLQAGVFTRDIGRGLDAASRLEYGGVLINEVPTFRADQMPYGGVKDSGNTREGPAYSVLELTEPRLVTLQG